VKPSSLRVVLVGPENPLNVGFVARAMRCFGVADLTVAASDWGGMPVEAYKTGGCVPEILDGARFVPTLEEALRGCEGAVAFSRRPSTLRRSEFTLPAVPAPLRRTRGTLALVFGRESAGLSREESALCPWLARIPCHKNLSLNLGQAVAVALFGMNAPEGGVSRPPRAGVSLDRMLSLWDFVAPRMSGARFTAERLQRTRQMFYRLSLDDDDFDMLFSVLRAVAGAQPSRRIRE
jgi:tRNA/rRNA methyltransferase